MINSKNLFPKVYYDESRDFQILGRTFEVLFNYLKTGVDLIYNNPLSKNSDAKLLQLLTKTIGFESKHEYNDADLRAICSSFSEIIKKKGSLESLVQAINVLLNVQQIDKQFEIEVDKKDNYNLVITIPSEIKDLVLLEDLFNYILPAGFTYTFAYAEFARPVTTKLTVNNKIPVNIKVNSELLGQVTKGEYGINDIKPSLMTEEQINNINTNGLGLNYIGKVISEEESEKK